MTIVTATMCAAPATGVTPNGQVAGTLITEIAAESSKTAMPRVNGLKPHQTCKQGGRHRARRNIRVNPWNVNKRCLGTDAQKAAGMARTGDCALFRQASTWLRWCSQYITPKILSRASDAAPSVQQPGQSGQSKGKRAPGRKGAWRGAQLSLANQPPAGTSRHMRNPHGPFARNPGCLT